MFCFFFFFFWGTCFIAHFTSIATSPFCDSTAISPFVYSADSFQTSNAFQHWSWPASSHVTLPIAALHFTILGILSSLQGEGLHFLTLRVVKNSLSAVILHSHRFTGKFSVFIHVIHLG
uniref:Putative secreted protein n=1 Tax=Rhipicephalus microplus TaxID=6941 RepID=A0A6M2DBV2_RHIMP